jgi:HAD superfamily hydrolase (TIGR01490 family)
MKLKLSIYDFDYTLYHGDSFTVFWLYSILRRPYIILLLPYQLFMGLLCLLRIISLSRFKEAFFCYVLFIGQKNFDKYVSRFWDKNRKRIYGWVKSRISEEKSDGFYLVCISASPSFLLDSITKELGFDLLISSDYLIKNGNQTNRLVSPNCRDKEKVVRLERWAKQSNTEYHIARFYSDSKSDLPLFNLAESPYFVKNGKIIEGVPK